MRKIYLIYFLIEIFLTEARQNNNNKNVFDAQREYDVTKDFVRIPKTINSPHDDFYSFKTQNNFTIDVSKHFPLGLGQEHSFECIFRIKPQRHPVVTWNLMNLDSMSSGNQIYLSVYPLQKSIEFYARFSGRITKVTIPSFEIFNGQWHHIKYLAKGGVFTFWIDCGVQQNSGMVETSSHRGMGSLTAPRALKEQDIDLTVVETFNSQEFIEVDIKKMLFNFNPNTFVQVNCSGLSSESIKHKKSIIVDDDVEIFDPIFVPQSSVTIAPLLTTTTAKNWEREYNSLKKDIENVLNSPKNIGQEVLKFSPDIQRPKGPIQSQKGEPGLPGVPGKCDCPSNMNSPNTGACSLKPSDIEQIKNKLLHEIQNDPKFRGAPGKPGLEGIPGISAVDSFDPDGFKASILNDIKAYVDQYIEVRLNYYKTANANNNVKETEVKFVFPDEITNRPSILVGGKPRGYNDEIEAFHHQVQRYSGEMINIRSSREWQKK